MPIPSRSSYLRLAGAWLATVAAIIAWEAAVATTIAAQDAPPPGRTTVPLDVRVLTTEGMGLGYSAVSVPQQDLERFSDASGRAVFMVAPGRVLLRIKRLGFTPRDTTLEVRGATVVRIALERVSFRLTEVTVVAWPPCKRPGLPRRSADPQLVGIVDQLRENAERYRLLTRRYPFSYDAERSLTEEKPGGPVRVERIDTIVVRGDVGERYQPGRIARYERQGRGRRAPGQWMMRIPTLADLGDDRFIDNHCFHVAGLEQKGDERLLRIDIVAAERLRSPDVNVTVWLDPQGFQLRHASFTLVKAEQFPHLRSVVSDVIYSEVVPFVPVMSEIDTESLVQLEREAVTYGERQVLVRLTFRGDRP